MSEYALFAYAFSDRLMPKPRTTQSKVYKLLSFILEENDIETETSLRS